MWLPDPVTVVHVDQDSDDIFQARQELNNFGNAINQIRSYLVNLLGVDGSHETAIATLFRNQAVLFPAGTSMYFMQATVPPGWVKRVFDQGRYLMAVSDDTGGQAIGSNDVWLQSSATSLIREQLPAGITMGGSASFVGDHSHVHERLQWNWAPIGAGGVRVMENGGGNWVYFGTISSGMSGAGGHSHSIEVNLGGAGWGHDHWTYMGSFQPTGVRGVIGQKA